MSKFHMGDRVRIVQKHYRGSGMTGVVTTTESGSDHFPYGVAFDEYVEDVGIYDIFAEEDLRPAEIVALAVGKPSGEDGQYQAGDQVKVYPVNLVENPSMKSSTEGWGAIQEAVDVVNHPPHYNRFPVEVINITEQLDFNRGNAVKYLARAGFKEGVDELEDLSKAAWYVNRAIEKLTKERENG